MIRGLWFIFQLALLVVVSVWVAQQKGAVSIQWHGWLLETSVGVLLAVVALLAVVVILLWRVWRGLRATPHAIGRMQSRRRRNRGYISLVRAHSAIAAGDGATALRHAGDAGAVAEPALAHLAAAEAAELAGDAARAETEYAVLAERPDTALIGLRGQIGLAESRGDLLRAIALARAARKLAPKSPWALRRLFELEGKAGAYDDAERTLSDAARLGAFPAGAEDRLLARVLYTRARKADEAGAGHLALADAERAHKLDPASPDYAVLAAGLLVKSGRASAAEKILTRAWQLSPTQAVAAAWMALVPKGDPTATLRQAERLHALGRELPEGRLALAEAQLAQGRWAEARAQLAAVAAGGHADGTRYPRLMAYLESASGHQENAREWFEKSLAVEPLGEPLALPAPQAAPASA
jgi:HemY protein